MDTIDTTKLLSPAEQPVFAALAARHGLMPADLAELVIKQALYSRLDLGFPGLSVCTQPARTEDAAA